MSNELSLEIKDGVATISINRPEKRNSFTDDMMSQWVAWLEECRVREDVKVIVITGTGGYFCAGGDVSGLADKAEQTPIQAKQRMMDGSQRLIRKFAEIDKPTIAAVDGAAVGGGMDVALMCDIRLASNSARFAETYARMGLVPGMGGAYLLPRLIGRAAALDLLYTCRWVDAPEAKDMGLVNHVYPTDTFREDVATYVAQIARGAPLAVRYIKRLVDQGLDSDLTSHLDTLSSHIAIVRTSSDHKEAVAAFKEKRSPRFTGS